MKKVWFWYILQFTFSICLAVSISLSTTWLMINTVVERSIQQFMTNEMTVSFSHLMSQYMNIVGGNATGISKNLDLLEVGDSNQEEAKQNDDAEYNSIDEEILNEAAVPVFQNQPPQSELEGEEDTLLFSAEQLESTKDSLSDEEKTQIFTLLISKLPQEQLLQFSEMMEGGITEEESIEIINTISQYLSEEEVSTISEMLNIY
ncbi:hypothetical protein [Longirhabdus pacifica]|uniref:hypothetical protein n=1 Tax=Longirhabdus pacifica TaxID=2305227 RepID=UPI00100935AC|nr:hypothetical protein [Longirhabdus pacifica]